MTYDYLVEVIDSCQKKYLNFKPLTKILSQVFSSAELLNESFLCSKFSETGPESVLPIDHHETLKAYQLLLSLDEEPVNNAIINGINALGNRIDIEYNTHKKMFTKHDLNQFIIILLNPDLLSPDYLDCGLQNILNAIANLPVDLQLILVKYWSKYTPEELQRVLDVFQQMITLRILIGPHSKSGRPVNDDLPITSSVKCMKLIYYASLYGGEFEKKIEFTLENPDTETTYDINNTQMRLLQDVDQLNDNESNSKKDELLEVLDINVLKSRKPLIPHKSFLNECLNDSLEMDRDFNNYMRNDNFSFLNLPFVLNTETKCSGLFYDSQIRMYSQRRISVIYGLFNGHVPSPYLKLKVRRDHLIQDALVRVSMQMEAKHFLLSSFCSK